MMIMPLGCVGDAASSGGSSSQRQFPLATLPTSTVTVSPVPVPGQSTRDLPAHTFRIWIANTPDTQQEGFMFVPIEEIADDQGMLFVFSDERVRGFWMKNTITSLDIAFARSDGTIVAVHTMPPLTLQTFSSIEPAMFALEVKAGTFARLGIREGDRLAIPDDVFR
jgi:uncharacterized membrane protein (UPF0127 family)